MSKVAEAVHARCKQSTGCAQVFVVQHVQDCVAYLDRCCGRGKDTSESKRNEARGIIVLIAPVGQTTKKLTVVA